VNHTTFDTPPIRGQKHFGTGGTFHTYARTATPEHVAQAAPVAVAEPLAGICDACGEAKPQLRPVNCAPVANASICDDCAKPTEAVPTNAEQQSLF
jgi:hypothetical protein